MISNKANLLSWDIERGLGLRRKIRYETAEKTAKGKIRKHSMQIYFTLEIFVKDKDVNLRILECYKAPEYEISCI
jgi:hypothetical protein